MSNDETSDVLELGGSIELSGFNELDRSTMVIVKKIVGNYAKRFSEICNNFEALKVKLNQEAEGHYVLDAHVSDNGSAIQANIKDKNLFFALDKVLKEVEGNLSK